MHPSDNADVPQPVRYRDLFSIVPMMQEAFAQDPLELYFQNTPDDNARTLLGRFGHTVLLGLRMFLNVFHGRLWALHRSASVVSLDLPDAPAPAGAEFVEQAVMLTAKTVRSWTLSKEQQARVGEFRRAFGQASEAAFGDELARMVEIGTLATRRGCGGRGYARTLVRLVTTRADEKGMRTYLGSTNVTNRGFYAALGFRVVKTFTVGGDNPSWTGEPVEVDIMVREVGGERPDAE